jgi:hypothetical protein
MVCETTISTDRGLHNILVDTFVEKSAEIADLDRDDPLLRAMEEVGASALLTTFWASVGMHDAQNQRRF